MVGFNVIKRIQRVRAVHFFMGDEFIVRFSPVRHFMFFDNALHDDCRTAYEKYAHTNHFKLKNASYDNKGWDENNEKKYKKPVPFSHLQTPSHQLSHHYSLKTPASLWVFVPLYQPGGSRL